jgi:hypothetical protein
MKRLVLLGVMLALLIAAVGEVASVQAQHQGRITGGTIRRPGDVHSYKLRGSLGQGLIFMAGSSTNSRFNPYLELYDSRNNLLHWDDNSAGGRDALILWPVLWNDTYEIRISSPAGTTGEYMLIYGGIDLISKQIRRPGAVNQHTFYGEQGQIVIAGTVRPDDSTLDPYITLFAPDGKRLTGNDDVGDSLDAGISYWLPQTGTYTINVSGVNRTTGRYQLIVFTVP